VAAFGSPLALGFRCGHTRVPGREAAMANIAGGVAATGTAGLPASIILTII